MCVRLLKCHINTYKHVHVRGLSHFCVHIPYLGVGRPSHRVGIPSERAVSAHTRLQASPLRQTVSIRRFL